MRVAAVQTVVPDHRYDQDQITQAVVQRTDADERLVRRFHTATQVTGRSLALPIDEYVKLGGFTGANDVYIETAVELASRAVRDALGQSGFAPQDVDHLIFCSSTGVATPSLDARVAQRVGLREDITRVPMFGLGCAAGAAGLSRLYDHLRGWPERVAVLVCVELCSLTVQREDTSVANLVASGLFGDGSAAVVAVGTSETTAPTEGHGWSRPAGSIPTPSASWAGTSATTASVSCWPPTWWTTSRRPWLSDVGSFLGDHGLSVDEVDSWVCHPGGPKVIEIIQQELGLEPDALDITWNSLRTMGNLSSVSVLNVLQETIAHRRPPDGEPGLLMALGPGFSAELVLLRW